MDALDSVYRFALQLTRDPCDCEDLLQDTDVEDQTYESAATILDVPIGTVRSRLFRGRRLLQRQLFAYAEDAGLISGRRGAYARPAS